MKREEILRTKRGLEFPLVPLPFCRFCTNPIAEKWATIGGRCFACKERLGSGQTRLGPDSPEPAAGLRASDAGIHPYAFGRAVAVGLYVKDAPDKGEFGRHVYALKYHEQGATDLAEALDTVLRERFPDIRFDLVVPMPPEPENQRNAPLLLTRAFASRRDCPTLIALSLDPEYRSDKHASALQKFNATKERFRVHSEQRFGGKRILLVDDIMTTAGHAHWGSTALMQRGAASVDVAVLARNFDRQSLKFIGYTGRV